MGEVTLPAHVLLESCGCGVPAGHLREKQSKQIKWNGISYKKNISYKKSQKKSKQSSQNTESQNSQKVKTSKKVKTLVTKTVKTDTMEWYYSKTSLIRTPLNRNSAKPNKPMLRTSFYLNRTNFG